MRARSSGDRRGGLSFVAQVSVIQWWKLAARRAQAPLNCDQSHISGFLLFLFLRPFFAKHTFTMAWADWSRSSKLTTAVLLGALMVWFAGMAHSGSDYDRLLASLTQRWGTGPVTKFNAWRALIVAAGAAQDTEKLKKANDFFNRQMQFGDDMVVWGQQDYWATPMESLGKGAGDCEDFAIAKYFTLREMGVAKEKLRLVYVRAKTGTSDTAPTQAHMVLAYYPQPDAEPMVLDNLIGEIRPASRRPDLAPVFSFNSDGVFNGVSAKDSNPVAGVGRLSRWEDLLKRAYAEGFE